MNHLETDARRRTVPVVLLTLLAATLVATPPAHAGGCDSYYPVHDRYEPGDVVTMVGYTAAAVEGWRDRAPYVAIVRPHYEDDPDGIAPPIPVGELEITEIEAFVGWPGAEPRPALRASVSFTIASDFSRGRYAVDSVGRDDAGLGWLCAGPLNVGVDPIRPLQRHSYWPPDEPEWANVVTVPIPMTAAPPPAPPTTPPPPSTAAVATTSSTATTSTSTAIPPVAPTATVDGSAEYASSALPGAAGPTKGPPGWLVGLGSLLLLGAALAYGQRRTISQAPSEDRT